MAFDRRAFIRSLTERDGDIVVANNPDHPWLYRNPDMLVAARGRLIAIFVPTVQERLSPDHLLGRYIACRLGLPVSTIFVAFLDPTQQFSQHLEYALNNFHAVIEGGHVQSTLQIVRSGVDNNRIHDTPPELRARYNQLTNLCLYTTRQELTKQRRGLQQEVFLNFAGQNPRAMARSWVEVESTGRYRREIRYRRVLSLDEDRIGLTYQDFGTVDSGLRTIRDHCLRSLRLSYAPDMGGIYPTTTYVTFLLASSLPETSIDPDWTLRVFALCRIAVSSAGSPQEFTETKERFLSKVGN